MRKLIAIVWLITFIIVLPLMAQRWVFSPLFYASKSFKAKATSLVDELNALRYSDAEVYFQSLDINYEKQFHKRQLSNEFAVVVVTKKRFVCAKNEFHCEPHYLQQTLAALDYESKSAADKNIIPIVVCSVDPFWESHEDLLAITKYFPIMFRYNSGYNSTGNIIPTNKEQETSDYAFCLEEASIAFNDTTKYLVVVEDDAIVFEHFFTTLSSILRNRIETSMLRGEKISNERRWCWMKLYFPEFWSGYGFDLNRISELFWIAMVGGIVSSMLAFALETVQRTKVSVFKWSCHGALYLVLIAVIVSRPTWLEMRRIHVSLMQVTPDSGCCSTVAVLYPVDEISKIVSYLRSRDCARCQHGVDLAIRDYKDKFDMLGLLVQPNLARHIGLYSTVSADYKNPVDMLFYDLL